MLREDFVAAQFQGFKVAKFQGHMVARARAPFSSLKLWNLQLEEFNEGIGHFCTVVVSDAHSRTLHFSYQAVEIVAGVGDAHDANGGTIPEFGPIEFCDRNVEAGPQLVLQAPHNLPAVLKRVRSFDVEFEGEEGDHAVG